MAVVFVEGFDHISAAQSTSKGWSAALNAVVAGRLGGQACRTASTGLAGPSHALPSSYSSVIAGFAFQSSGIAATVDFFALRSGGTNVVRLRLSLVSGSNVLQVLNAAGTVLATGTTPILASVWYYIEVKVVVSATVGTVEVRLNGLGTTEASATGVNTGASNVDTIILGSLISTAGIFDDMYVCDTSGSAPTNDFLGDYRVETLITTAEGANTAWTANTGTKAGAVDDATSYDSDTTYILDSTPGDRETFTIASLAVGTGTVFAVQTNLVARKDDAGARTIAPVIRTGGVNYDGTTTAGLSTSYLDYTQLYDRLDPAGSAWSIATVNAMEVGVKEVA